MVIYNDSFMNNVTSFVDLFTGISSVTNNGTFSSYLIGYLILLSFFIIFLIMTMQNGFMEVLIIDSFLTTLIAILFLFAGLVNVVAVLIPAIICFIVILSYVIFGGM